jgi:hypothetical protein
LTGSVGLGGGVAAGRVVHHTFRAGSRIEIDVTSSNFPRRARNTNSGHPVLVRDREADIRVATNTVHHAPATPSVVELPVLGRWNQTRGCARPTR